MKCLLCDRCYHGEIATWWLKLDHHHEVGVKKRGELPDVCWRLIETGIQGRELK